MIKPYASKKAAIRYALSTWGAEWPARARYLEVKLPDNEVIYMIQPREEMKPSTPIIEEQAPMSALLTEAGAIKRMWAIFDILRQHDPKISRKELLNECVRQGLRRNTAATQYQAWLREQDSEAPAAIQAH